MKYRIITGFDVKGNKVYRVELERKFLYLFSYWSIQEQFSKLEDAQEHIKLASNESTDDSNYWIHNIFYKQERIIKDSEKKIEELQITEKDPTLVSLEQDITKVLRNESAMLKSLLDFISLYKESLQPNSDDSELILNWKEMIKSKISEIELMLENLEEYEYLKIAILPLLEHDNFDYMNKKSKIIKTGVDDNEHY